MNDILSVCECALRLIVVNIIGGGETGTLAAIIKFI